MLVTLCALITLREIQGKKKPASLQASLYVAIWLHDLDSNQGPND